MSNLCFISFFLLFIVVLSGCGDIHMDHGLRRGALMRYFIILLEINLT